MNNESFKIRVVRYSVSTEIKVRPIQEKDIHLYHIEIEEAENFNIYRADNGKWAIHKKTPHLLEEGLIEKIGEAIDNKGKG